MGRAVTVLFIIIVAMALLAAPAYAVSSAELIENAKEYEGTRISLQGEAIGDIMKRGSYGWINIHDGDSAIGVWAPVGELRKITFTGDYAHNGDTVLVNGTFSQACPEHGGDIDIHADSITIVSTGNRVERPVDTGKAVAAAILLLVAVALFVVERYQKRHSIAPS